MNKRSIVASIHKKEKTDTDPQGVGTYVRMHTYIHACSLVGLYTLRTFLSPYFLVERVDAPHLAKLCRRNHPML